MTERAQAAIEPPDTGKPDPLLLSDATLSEVARAAASGRRWRSALTCPGPIHLTLRREGRPLARSWLPAGDLEQALAGAFLLARQFGADVLQLDLCHDEREVGPRAFKATFPNAARGIRGIGLVQGGRIERHPPSQMIAANRGFEQTLALCLRQRGQDEPAFIAAGGRILAFEARQLLIRLQPEIRALSLFRGGRIVRLETVGRSTIRAMIEGMAGWLRRNLGDDGRMTYKYWPSRGVASGADNTIRQFMATVCLIRLAARSGDPADQERADRNLRHNLQRFYREQDGIGMIALGDSAKLGASALAALAILEAPSGERFRPVLEKLDAGIRALAQPDGSFRTFHLPPERNDNQNFYPGQALLYWAARHARSPDTALLQRCRRSFLWYRDWHRRARNPAFIPWHTQALSLLFEATGEAEFRDFVLEMNDWLAGFQQWQSAPHPDLAGRFYDPKRPALGPPHASSTGVYLEGLVDALTLAQRIGDRPRASLYRRTIWRGIRNLRQLQFKDEVDMVYIQHRERVLGGVRTEAYDNTIRVDNVQHGLMALLKLERTPHFMT